MRWLTRLEYLALMTASGLLMLLHAGDVHWGRAVIAFAAIDLIGYIPGARAFRRAGKGRISPIYHHLYNVTHNFLTAAVVTAVWAVAGGGLEWAMLAIPLHLAGDRGIFGNGFKPVARPFDKIGDPERVPKPPRDGASAAEPPAPRRDESHTADAHEPAQAVAR